MSGSIDEGRIERERAHFSKASPLVLMKRVVVDEKPTSLRFERLRRSAMVSSRTGAAMLYRPTPTDCNAKAATSYDHVQANAAEDRTFTLPVLVNDRLSFLDEVTLKGTFFL